MHWHRRQNTSRATHATERQNNKENGRHSDRTPHNIYIDIHMLHKLGSHIWSTTKDNHTKHIRTQTHTTHKTPHTLDNTERHRGTHA